MTRHRRQRRPDDGKYQLKDQQTWWRLIRRARACARNPGRPALDLAAAATAAARAVIPPGYANRESPFVKLLLKARIFDSAYPTLRGPIAEQLEALAGECAAILDAPAPERRLRADLEG